MCSLVVNPHFPFSHKVLKEQGKCLHHGLSLSNSLAESEF